MIAVLQDGKELINRKDAQDAVKKLEELKNEDFIVTTENMERVLRDIREEMGNLRKLTEGLATKDACEDLKRKLSALECLMSEQSEEMKRLKIDDSAHKEQSEYEKSKLDLQKKLIKNYREDILRMSALPLQQEGNLCDFKDVYIRPRMTIQSKSYKKTEEADVLSMSDIFTKDGKTIKFIYVLGEAGSGKSSFCKSLVHFWCLAHSDEGKDIDDAFSGVKEMKKFNFLFYLPLRHYTDKIKIKEMLEGKYEHFALKKLLECESRNCLIVLDGLDEWASPASRCPPERGAVNEYTVLTTSRPWKISTLEITDNEIRQKIILKGFDDEISINNMIEKTVPILNKMFERDRVLSDCQMALENAPMKSLKHTAIMLQQLICLWFDDKLHGETSRCAMYAEILDLFFDWHMKKHPDGPLFTEMMKKSEDHKNVELPDYLIDTEVCNSYSYIIHDVSRLAYNTLFNNTKDTSLSFDSSTLKRLKISEEVKSCCLKLGILSEDKCMSFSASKSRRPVIAFVHKSFQEYLAAVYIAIRFKEHISHSADSGNPDLSDHCALLIRDFFSKCTTLDEILEQANVFIMLCGLEPRIAISISKYIYDIVTRDKRVLQYRRTIHARHEYWYLISNIQECLTNCTDEVQACGTRIQSNFYLGDINFVYYYSDCEHLCKSFERQAFCPDSITSIRILPHKTDTYLKRALKYLSKCQRLEAICIDMNINDDEDNKYVCDVIEDNILTLRALSVRFSKLICRIVSRLPDISHLVALKIGYVIMPHEDVISLCTFLSGSSHLEQMSIIDTDCEPSTDSECSTVFLECINQHEVDLSKHQHLQYLECDDSVIVTRVNTSNLEIFKHSSLKNTNYVKVLDNLSKAFKLTELSLEYEIDGSNKNPTVTDKLITLLPLLYQLRKLTLEQFTLTENIMKFPSEMKSMKSINLETVRMSLTTWWQFVDSLPLIPLPVKIKTLCMCITRDGEEYNPDTELWAEGGEEAAAWQYVRENKALFNVEYESKKSIDFSVKK